MSQASASSSTSIYAPGGSISHGVPAWALIVGLLLAAFVVWKLFRKKT